MGFCMALSMNSVGIPGGFRGKAGFWENLGFGVVSGDLGGRKAFAQIATSCSDTCSSSKDRLLVSPALGSHPSSSEHRRR